MSESYKNRASDPESDPVSDPEITTGEFDLFDDVTLPAGFAEPDEMRRGFADDILRFLDEPFYRPTGQGGVGVEFFDDGDFGGFIEARWDAFERRSAERRSAENHGAEDGFREGADL